MLIEVLSHELRDFAWSRLASLGVDAPASVHLGGLGSCRHADALFVAPQLTLCLLGDDPLLWKLGIEVGISHCLSPAGHGCVSLYKVYVVVFL